MTMKRLGLAVAILSTLGFSCHNEPDDPRPGMSNPPGGSGGAAAPASAVAPPAAAPVAPAPTARP